MNTIERMQTLNPSDRDFFFILSAVAGEKCLFCRRKRQCNPQKIKTEMSSRCRRKGANEFCESFRFDPHLFSLVIRSFANKPDVPAAVLSFAAEGEKIA